jgi:hypothetical protein
MDWEDSVSFCSVVVNFLLFAGSVSSSGGGVLTQRMRVVLETFCPFECPVKAFL